MNPNFRGRLALAAQICLVVATPSCYTSMGKWTYPSGRYKTATSAKPAAAVVAVEPLLDLRSDTNKSYMALSYVPIWPLGWGNFQRPEATIPDLDTTRYRGDIPQDLARSVAIELDRERLVAHAEFASDANKVAGATHVLRGKLRSFYVEESRWTYGFSTLAPALWVLGLPQGTSGNGFCVDFELVESASAKVVWQGRVFDSDFHVEGYYYGPEWYRFSWMWERRLRAKLGDLAKALGGEAAPLPPDLASEIRECPPQCPADLGVDGGGP